MSALGGFFGPLKDDLLDRRLRPFLLVLAVALVAAVGYAALGGGSATPAPSVSATPPTGSTAPTGVAVSQAPANPNAAVAETTDGVSKQHQGVARDPFTAIPGVKAAASSAKPTGGSKAASSKPAAPSTSSAGGTTPAAPAKETTPPAKAKPKPKTHYNVTVELGVVPPVAEGAPPQPAQMKTYKDLALREPLPGKTDPQLVYRGVVVAKAGMEATFALSGGAILHGSATCKPSPTQCQTIVLQVGQSETLEVLEADGSAVTYELKLLSIEQGSASAARARAARRRRQHQHGH